MKPGSQEGEPTWEGDLEDDCSARWCGFLLRVEWMDDGDWWWGVYSQTGEEIDSSNNYEAVVSSGEAARRAAEMVIRKFVNSN